MRAEGLRLAFNLEGPCLGFLAVKSSRQTFASAKEASPSFFHADGTHDHSISCGERLLKLQLGFKIGAAKPITKFSHFVEG